MGSEVRHPYLTVPDDWTVRPLKDLTTKVGSGATPRGGKNAYVDEGVRLIRSQNVHDLRFEPAGLAHITDEAAAKLAGVEVRLHDVLLNITGASIARCCQVPEWSLPARVNQHVAIVRPTDRLHPSFLMYLLVHPTMREYVLSHNAGASREAITKRHIEHLLVPVPPIEEQRAIAEVLGALDDRIEWCDAGTSLAHDLARSVAEQHEADATVRLADVADIRRSTISATELQGRSWTHYSIPAFDDGQQALVESGSEIRSGKFSVPPDSVLVSKLNPTWPRVWLPATEDDPPAICSTELMPLVPSEPSEVSTAALWAALLTAGFNRQLRERVQGSTGSHQRVRPEDMLACRVMNPAALTKSTGKLLASSAARVRELRVQRRSLVRSRDALLPRLLSGEVRIEDPARLSGAVA